MSDSTVSPNVLQKKTVSKTNIALDKRFALEEMHGSLWFCFSCEHEHRGTCDTFVTHLDITPKGCRLWRHY